MTSRLPPLYIVGGVAFAALALLIQLLLGSRSKTNIETGQKTSDNVATATIMDGVTATQQAGPSLYWIAGNVAYRLSLADQRATPNVFVSLPFSPINAVWSPSGTGLLTIESDEGTSWQFFAAGGGGAARSLDINVVEPAFSSDGKRILYSFSGKERRPVAIADPDGQNWNNILAPNHLYLKLWWPGSGTYALARDIFSEPPSYVRLLMSSKRTEHLATGYEEEMNAAVSPNGTRVVIDGEVAADPVLRLVTLDEGKIQTLDVRSVARLAAWQDDATVLIIQADGMVASVDVNSRAGTQLGTLPSSLAPDQLVAVTENDLYLVSVGSLVRVARSALTKP